MNINLTAILEKLNLDTAYFDLSDYIDDVENVSDSRLRDAIYDATSEINVIYYSKAIAYLQQNDPSLQQSLSLASELGFSLENLNSELLATLHLQDELRNEYYAAVDDILEAIADEVDANKYDEDGYDENGYDADGFDRYGYNADGYDSWGFDVNGFDESGYDSEGYDESGYDEDGYDRDGYDENGYDEDGNKME